MLMRRNHIVVIEDGEKYGYHLMSMENGMPYYVPDDEIIFEEGVNSDSVLIIPVDDHTFLKDRKSLLVAFRIRFDSSEHSTVMFGVDPNNLSWTKIQLKTSVNRVLYKIDRNLNLVVQEERDPMLPPSVTEFNAPSSNIGEMILEVTDGVIEAIGGWVLKHRI